MKTRSQGRSLWESPIVIILVFAVVAGVFYKLGPPGLPVAPAPPSAPPQTAPATNVAHTDSSTQSVTATFDECNAARRRMVSETGVSSRDVITMMDNSQGTITRICTADGSVLVTCSRPDQKMIITKSPHSSSSGCRR